jgi:hypothetical protein
MNISNKSLQYRNSFLTVVIFSAGIAFSAQFYTYFFYEALITGDMHGEIDFTGIVISDTFFYKTVLNWLVTDAISLFWLLQSNNYFVPVFIWYLSGDNWYLTALLNAMLVFFSFLYFIKLCRLYNLKLDANIFFIYIGLSPIFIYYSIGALKELPCLLGIMGFFYHYLKRHKVSWIFYFFILILIRKQLVIPLFIFIIFDKAVKNQLMACFITVLLAGGLYPFFQYFDVAAIVATELYRENQRGSLGALIESIRSSIPILSSAAVLLRAIQSVFEPILTFIMNPTVYEDDAISLYLLANLIQNIVLTPFWILSMIGIVNKIFFCNIKNRDTRRLYAFIILYVAFIGGFSFIHHRYLFPLIGVILIGGLIVLKEMASLTMTKKGTKYESSC